jgi:DNA-nicking Smr family endonuclease
MGFEVGDKVDVMDEDLSGIITSINGNIISIETTDGFELDFSGKELVNIDDSASLTANVFSKTSLNEAISEKETKKRTSVKKKSKERFQPTLEVDLHIHQLTNSYKRLENHEILSLQLDTAKRQLEFAIQKRIQRIVFIHGVGEGVLKIELEYLFKRYENLKFYEANYKKYGLGATEVYLFQNRK